MFAVLCINSRKRKIFGKIKFDMCAAENIEYFRIDIFGRLSRRRWTKLWNDFYRENIKIIIPQDVHPTDIFIDEKYVFDSGILKKKMLFNTAVRLLKRRKHSKICVCLEDENADYIQQAEKLLKYSETVKIITRKFDEYEQLSDELLEKYGAGLVIANEAGKCDIIIKPECGQLIILGQNYHAVNDKKMKFAQLSKHVPTGIAPIDFAAALYEYGDTKHTDDLYFEQLECAGKTENIQLICNKMQKAQDKL